MDARKNAAVRDTEHPDPQELNRPVPKILLALIALLLGWAVYYIATHASAQESSIAPKAERASAVAQQAPPG
jgi:hypothetical protein